MPPTLDPRGKLRLLLLVNRSGRQLINIFLFINRKIVVLSKLINYINKNVRLSEKNCSPLFNEC